MTYVLGYEPDGTPTSMSPDGLKWFPLDPANPDFMRYLIDVKDGVTKEVLPEEHAAKFIDVVDNWREGKPDLMEKRQR